MLRYRYQPPKRPHADSEQLPTDTVCTVLTRQSTTMQAERNQHSDELHPDDLIAVAVQFGFQPDQIRLVDADMGIGAYSTTIGERPGLRQWLQEWLPAGISRVVLVSQEDRLFRDRWEDQHNAFIRQVAEHGGWVLCARPVPHVYNFRREMDCEQFRMACKYGRLYIEHHIKGRLHPAAQRAAMQGRYVSGMVPWGYIVDYDPHSPTYKHLLRYQMHAVLVSEQVFARFIRMERPSVTELARSWWREGLVWPFFGKEIDERRVRWLDAKCRRDEQRGGYLFDARQAQTILTNMVYLGWMVRKGDYAKDATTGQPTICHEPLVAPDMFWWCYDHVLPERPSWAPAKATQVAVSSYHPRRSRTDEPGEVRFLAHGHLRCAQHGKRVVPIRVGAHERHTTDEGQKQLVLRCWVTRERHFDVVTECAAVPAATVEEAVCHSFVEHLQLDDRDLRQLAHLAQRRERGQRDEIGYLEAQLSEQKATYDGALRLAVHAPDLAGDVVEQVRKSKRTIAELEARIAELRAADAPSTRAWQQAERAVGFAERIRATFTRWSRPAQARVLAMALDDAVLGRVDRRSMGLWMRWHGGAVARVQLARPNGQKLLWTPDEDAALRAHYHELTHDALELMLPARPRSAIRTRAYELGLSRPRHGVFSDVVPLVVPGTQTVNEMAAYGFPMGGVGVVGDAGSNGWFGWSDYAARIAHL